MQYKYTIDERYSGQTLGVYLHHVLGLSSLCIRQLKRTPCSLRINAQPVYVSYRLQGGETLLITLSELEKASPVLPENLPLDIVFEDADYLALNKPPGLAMHPSTGRGGGTLANAVAYYFRDEPFVFRSLNRLDRDTSGLVLIAKHKVAANRQTLSIKKYYLGITDGLLQPAAGQLDWPIFHPDKDMRARCVDERGRAACTIYETKQTVGTLSLVAFTLLTGRTHQIRVHMAHNKTPILGDLLYGRPSPLIARQALHCNTIIWQTPDGKSYRTEAPLPPDMQAALKKE